VLPDTDPIDHENLEIHEKLNSAWRANLITFCWFKLCTAAEFAVIEVTRSDLTAKDAKSAKERQ
jgi:hypothetical protein